MNTMVSILSALTIFGVIMSISATPLYTEIPVDIIQDMNYASVGYQKIRNIRGATYEQSDEPDVSETRLLRQTDDHDDAHDYVDFGAHTGHHGAYGWYADYPIQNHDYH